MPQPLTHQHSVKFVPPSPRTSPRGQARKQMTLSSSSSSAAEDTTANNNGDADNNNNNNNNSSNNSNNNSNIAQASKAADSSPAAPVGPAGSSLSPFSLERDANAKAVAPPSMSLPRHLVPPSLNTRAPLPAATAPSSLNSNAYKSSPSHNSQSLLSLSHNTHNTYNGKAPSAMTQTQLQLMREIPSQHSADSAQLLLSSAMTTTDSADFDALHSTLLHRQDSEGSEVELVDSPHAWRERERLRERATPTENALPALVTPAAPAIPLSVNTANHAVSAAGNTTVAASWGMKSALSTPRASAAAARLGKKRVTMVDDMQGEPIAQNEAQHMLLSEQDGERERAESDGSRILAVSTSSSERMLDANRERENAFESTESLTASGNNNDSNSNNNNNSKKKYSSSWVGKTLAKPFRRSKEQKDRRARVRGMLSTRSNSSTDLSYDNFDNYHQTNFRGNNNTSGILSVSSRSYSNTNLHIYPNSYMNISADESFMFPTSTASTKRAPFTTRSMYEKELLQMLDQTSYSTAAAAAGNAQNNPMYSSASAFAAGNNNNNNSNNNSNINNFISNNNNFLPSLTDIRGPPAMMNAARTPQTLSLLSLNEEDANLDKTSRLVVSIPYTHRASWGTGLSALAISTNKRFVVSGGRYDGMIRTWDIITGQEIKAYSLEERVHIHCLALSPDDSFVLAGCSDGCLYLFDLESKEKIVLTRENSQAPGMRPSAVWSVAISPTQRFFVCGDGSRTITLWELAPPHNGEPLCVVMSESLAESYSFAWTHTSQQRFSWPRHSRPNTHNYTQLSSPQSVPTQRRLAPIVARKMLTESEEMLDRRINSLGISLDGQRITSTIANIVNVWDVESGTKLYSLNKFAFEIRFVMSPDASKLVSWGFGHSITLWRQTERDIHSHTHAHRHSHSQKQGEDVRQRESEWEEQHFLDARAHSVSLSQDGSLLFTGHNDGSAVLWDGITGEPMKFYRPGGADGGNNALGGAALVAISRDGTLMATADSKSSALKIWTSSLGDQCSVSEHYELQIKRRIDASFYVARNVNGSFVNVRQGQSNTEGDISNNNGNNNSNSNYNINSSTTNTNNDKDDNNSSSINSNNNNNNNGNNNDDNINNNDNNNNDGSASPLSDLAKSLSVASNKSVAGSVFEANAASPPSPSAADELCLFSSLSHSHSHNQTPTHTCLASLTHHKIFPENIKVVTADAKCAIVCTFQHRLKYWDLERDDLSLWRGFEDYLAMRCTVVVSPDQSAILVCGYFRRSAQGDSSPSNSFLSQGNFTSSLFRNQDEKLYKVFYWRRDTNEHSSPSPQLKELYSCQQFFYYEDAFVTVSCSYNASKVVFWSPENNGCFFIASPFTLERHAIVLPPNNNFIFLHCWHLALALNGTVCVLGSSSEKFFVWDVEMDEPSAEFRVAPHMVAQLGAVSSVKLANDNSFFVLAHKTGVTLWDGLTGVSLATIEVPEKFKFTRLNTLHEATSIAFVSITANNDEIRLFLNDSVVLTYRNIYSNHGLRVVNRHVKTQRDFLQWFAEDLQCAAKKHKRPHWVREEMHLHLLQNERFAAVTDPRETYDSLLHYAVKHQHAAPFVKEMLLMLPQLALVKRHGWNGRVRGNELVHESCSLLKRAARFNTKLCIKVVLDCLLAMLTAPKESLHEEDDGETQANIQKENEVDDNLFASLGSSSEKDREKLDFSTNALHTTSTSASALSLPATSGSVVNLNASSLSPPEAIIYHAQSGRQRRAKAPLIKTASAFLGNSASATLQRLPHLADLIDIADLCYVAKRSPDLFLDFVCKLVAVPNYYFVSRCERFSMTDRYILQGSRERSPKDFWQSNQEESSLFIEADSSVNYVNTVAYPVAPYVIPLRNLCSMSSPFIPTLVEAARSTDHFEVFDNEVVKMVLEYKWAKMCRDKFQRDFALKLLLFVAFSINSAALDVYARPRSFKGPLCFGLGLITLILLISLHFVRHEIEQCRSHYKSARTYFLDMWNLINIASNGLTLSTLGVDLYLIYLLNTQPETQPDREGEIDFYTRASRGMAAATFPLIGLEIMYFLGGMRSTGPIVRMIMEISKATRYFMSILLITVFSFAGSFMLLFRGQTLGHGDGYYYNGFTDYPRTLLTVYTFFFGGYKIQDLEQASSPALAIFLLCVFLCFVLIILFNMLIAIMRDRYDEVKAVYSAHATYSLTKLVLEYESITKESEKMKYRNQWYPEWIQVLQRIDKVHNFSASASMMSKVNVIKLALDDNLNRTDKIVAMIENTNHRRDALQQKVAMLDSSTKRELQEINDKLDMLYDIITKKFEDKE